MKLLSLIPDWAFVVLAIVIALGGAGALGYVKGRESGLKKYYELQTQVAAQVAADKANADATRLESERILKDTVAGWSAATGVLRGRLPVVRVLPGPDCNPQASHAGSAAGTDQATPVATPDATGITPAECQAYLGEALEDAFDYAWFQSWYFKQREALK